MTGSDAALLALCDAFHTEHDARRNVDLLLAEIEHLPAATSAGFAAKAQVAAALLAGSAVAEVQFARVVLRQIARGLAWS